MSINVFAATEAKDIKAGDIQMVMDVEKRECRYYYYFAKSVFVGEIVEAINDPFTGEFVGNRKTHCVEIVWHSMNYVGNDFTLRYKEDVVMDIAVSLTDYTTLKQVEDIEEGE